MLSDSTERELGDGGLIGEGVIVKSESANGSGSLLDLPANWPPKPYLRSEPAEMI